MYINPIIEGIEISDIRKIHERLVNYKNVINMTIGEPDIDVPQEVKEAMAYHALNSRIKYSPVGGMPELREKIAKYYNEQFLGNYNAQNVLVTVGSTEGLASVLKTILAKDDEVIIPTPAYVGYEPLITISEAKTKFVDLEENNFVLTKEILEKNITDKTKLIILTYPNNPSGITLAEIILNDKILKEKVVIAKDPTMVDMPNAEKVSRPKVYTLNGICVQGELENQPTGVYIVNGKKIVKK